MSSASERQIREILIAANSGEAADEQLQRLDAMICADSQLAHYAARVLDQQASLAWQGGIREHSAAASARIPARVRGAISSGSAPPAGSGASRLPVVHWNWPTLAVGVAFILGGLVAIVGSRMYVARSAPLPIAAVSPQPPPRPAYEARLVRSTACLWDGDSAGGRAVGSWLSSGESLHLLEGLAEFNLNWSIGDSATLSLEGPAAMMLTSEGMPTLRFGRLTATIGAAHRPFVLETPVGRLVVAEYGSIGVSAIGNDAEIHVFDGAATLEPTWPSSPGWQSTPQRLESGAAIRVQAGSDGDLAVSRHSADKGYFAAQVSMTSDPLIVSPAYVAAVKAAGPIGYWRFERSHWPRLPNEVGDRFDCRLHGRMGTAGHASNQAVEFGVTDRDGEINSSEGFDDLIGDSYSIEFWIKPSHYHVGAVISLVGDPETPSGVIPHGMLIELGGSGRMPSAIHHPGRIRFLHRSPASNDSELGTSCYSTAAYTLRKWQHVVAVKDGPAMRLFVDGELAGEAKDASRLPAGLRLLVGRLYPSRRVRPFIGQFDELALYDRALSQDEITQHFHLIRPPSADQPSI